MKIKNVYPKSSKMMQNEYGQTVASHHFSMRDLPSKKGRSELLKKQVVSEALKTTGFSQIGLSMKKHIKRDRFALNGSS